MAQIFISYRRRDSREFTDRLYTSLLRHYDSAQIFMDVDSIYGGQNFVQVLQRTLHRCDTLIAVIGPEWTSMEDDQGRRRLAQRDDFVRQEVHTALEREIVVIPVLFGATPMPTASDLPPSIRDLHVRQAIRIPEDRFDNAVDRLVEAIELDREERQQVRRTTQRRVMVSTLPTVGLGALIGALILGAITLLVGLISVGTGLPAVIGLVGGCLLGLVIALLLAGILQVLFMAAMGFIIGTVFGGPIGAPIGLVIGIALGVMGVSSSDMGPDGVRVFAGLVGTLAGAILGFHLLGPGTPVLDQLVLGVRVGWEMAGWVLLPGAFLGGLIALGLHARANQHVFLKKTQGSS